MKKIIISICLLCSMFSSTVFAQDELDLQSQFVYGKHLGSDSVVVDRNGQEKMYPASMTKIMSALVVLEQVDDLSQSVTITQEMVDGLAQANASVAGFLVGESVTYEDIVYGILFPSGADATQAAAFTLFDGVDGFVAQMNTLAKKIGMDDTNFANTSGLHDDNHYSTVQDIAVLLEYALQQETFKTMFTSDEYITSNARLTFISPIVKNELSYNIQLEEIKGGKTGFTNEASLCLASYAIIDGEEYIFVSGNAPVSNEIPANFLDAQEMVEYMKEHYGTQLFIEENTLYEQVEVKYSNESIDALAAQDIALFLKDYDESLLDGISFTSYELQAPIHEGDVIGVLQIKYDGDVIYSEDVLSTKDVSFNVVAFIMEYIIYIIVGIIVVSLFIVFVIQRMRNSERRRALRKRRY